ncbi:hypothetical protein GCM10029964_071610 [Kibdelosporangium lantanae]
MTVRLSTTALAVVGACVGAWLATYLRFTAEPVYLVGAVLVGALLALAVVVQTTAERPTEPIQKPAPRPQPQPAPRTAEAPTTRLVLDTDQPSGQWWTKAGARPATPSEAPRPQERARDLAGYAEAARVVQCPRCGSFQIDVTRLGGGYSFRCRTDENAWQWQPGREWPATVVVARRRTD